MSFFAKSSKPAIAQQQPSYGALRVQTSSYGGVIGVGFGTTRLTGNLIWSGDFESHAHTQSSGAAGGGKGGGGGASNTSTTYTYSTSFAMGLCQSSVTAIGTVWRAKEKTTLAGVGGSLFSGQVGQGAWGYLQTKHPDQALGYSATAYIGCADFDLGNSNSLPNLSFEAMMLGPPARVAVSPSKGHVSALVADLGEGLFDPTLQGTILALKDQAQASWDAGETPVWDTHFSWAVKTLLTAPWGASFPETAVADLAGYSSYCHALGFCLSVALQEARPVNEILDEWVRSTVAECVWSGGRLRIVPYSLEALTANGATYAPDPTPVYDLGPDDFITDMVDGGGDGEAVGAPVVAVTVSRGAQADTYNRVTVEFLDRADDYNVAVAEAEDWAHIESFGLRESPVAKSHWFTSGDVAALAAEMALARHLHVTTDYEFVLGWAHVLLEPMDLVTLTDTASGLDRELVRITEIEEDEDGRLMVRAENVPDGVVVPPATIAFQGGSGWAPNLNLDPGSCLDPIIFDAPAALANSPEIWLATNGGREWGGAQVWVSYDNETYALAGRVQSGARMGHLDAPLADGSGFDPLSVLSVDLTDSRGELLSGTPASAQALTTLCWVEGELLSYTEADLLAPHGYALSGLYRGAYGTGAKAHDAGARFVRLDGSAFRFSYPRDRIGQTVYIKLAAYNRFGGAIQGLDEVEPVAHTIAGPPSLPAPTNLQTASDVSQALTTNDGLLIARLHLIWEDPVPASSADFIMVQYKQSQATTWETMPLIPLGVGKAWISPVADGVAYDVRLRALFGSSSVSSWLIESGIVISCRASITVPPVSGLELFGQGNKTEFTGKDAKFAWRLSSATGASDFTDALSVADSGWRDDFFRSYVVRVYDLATGGCVRSEFPEAPTFTYTYEMNVEDGGPRRAFRLAVATIDVYGRTSEERSLVVSNPPPALPTAIALNSGFAALYLSFQPDPALDLAGCIVWASSSPGFEPSEATKVYQGSNTAITIPGKGMIYVRLASYDLFGTEDIELSPEFSAETVQINHQDLADGIISESKLFNDLGQRIERIDENSAALEDAFTSIDGLSAQYTVKLDLNGYVSGFGLASQQPEGESPFSEFIVRADRFAVGTPGADPAVPFIVQDGAVHIDGAQIAQASIGAASIYDLTADKLTAGKITADNIQLGGENFVLNAGQQSMEVKDGGTTRVLLGNLGNGYGLRLFDAAGNLIFGSGGFGANAVPFQAVAGLGAFAAIGKINADNASTLIENAAIGSALIGDLAAGKIKTGKIQNQSGTSFLNLDAVDGTADWLNANSDTAVIRGDGHVSFSAGEITGDFRVGGVLRSSMIQHCYGYGHVGGYYGSGLDNYTFATLAGPWEGYTNLENDLPPGSVWVLADIQPYIMVSQLGAYISGFDYVVCTLEAFVEGDLWKPLMCWADYFSLPTIYDGSLLSRIPRYSSYFASSRGLHGPLILGSQGKLRMRYQLTSSCPSEMVDCANMAERPWTKLASNQGGFQPVGSIPGTLDMYPVGGSYSTYHALYGGGFRAILMRVENPVLPSASGWTWGQVIIG